MISTMAKKKIVFGTFLLLIAGLSWGCQKAESSSPTSENTSSSEELSSQSSISETTESSAIPSSTSSQGESLTYHVRFLNDDETLLYETDVKEGGTALYVGDEPTKEEDDEFTYTFNGWDKDLTNVQEDFDAKAVYTAVPKENWGSISWF